MEAPGQRRRLGAAAAAAGGDDGAGQGGDGMGFVMGLGRVRDSAATARALGCGARRAETAGRVGDGDARNGGARGAGGRGRGRRDDGEPAISRRGGRNAPREPMYAGRDAVLLGRWTTWTLGDSDTGRLGSSLPLPPSLPPFLPPSLPPSPRSGRRMRGGLRPGCALAPRCEARGGARSIYNIYIYNNTYIIYIYIYNNNT